MEFKAAFKVSSFVDIVDEVRGYDFALDWQCEACVDHCPINPFPVDLLHCSRPIYRSPLHRPPTNFDFAMRITAESNA